jgi:hypothetical protein
LITERTVRELISRWHRWPENSLFQAVQVDAVKGTGKHLMVVEALGGGGGTFVRSAPIVPAALSRSFKNASTEAMLSAHGGTNRYTYTES